MDTHGMFAYDFSHHDAAFEVNDVRVGMILNCIVHRRRFEQPIRQRRRIPVHGRFDLGTLRMHLCLDVLIARARQQDLLWNGRIYFMIVHAALTRFGLLKASLQFPYRQPA